MNRALWIARKNEICHLIKKISDHHGGDNLPWLKDYCKELLMSYKDDLQPLYECMVDLNRQLKFVKARKGSHRLP